MERVLMAPAMHVWNSERQFPNVSPHGDGTMTFPTKDAYESHLKATGLREIAHDGLIKKPHGNKVIRSFK
jgi:hypothetical protein